MAEYISKYQTTKAGVITRFLWYCAGGDPILLNKGTYTDQVKIACMGGTVLSTAVLAFFAGTYAFHTIFSDDPNSEISILEYGFGLLWGAIIFNIDRFIVSSTQPKVKKMGLLETSKTALPRIAMGIVISLIISKPLELKIFEKDIELAIAKTKEEKFSEIKNATRSKFKNEESILESKIAKFEKEILDLENQRDKYDSLFQVEARIVTVGPRAQAMQKGRDDALKRIHEIKKSQEYSKLLEEKDLLFDKINQNAEIERKSVDLGMRSLVSKIKLSHEIAPVISNMITLLFIILELTPIIFKLLMEKSPIDYLMYNRNEVIKAQNLIEEEKDTSIKIKSNAAEKLLEQLKKQNEHTHARLYKEFETLEKMKHLIAEYKNLEYFNNNVILVNIEEDRKIKENQFQSNKNKEEYEIKNNELKVIFDVDNDRKEKFKINEIDLNQYTIDEYNKIERQKISANPIDSFNMRFGHLYSNGNNNNEKLSKVEPLIQDELINDKFWKPGDSYSKIKIFTKEHLKKKLSIEDKILENAFNSELNKVLTSQKISESKRNENLKEWAYKNDNITKFNINEEKLISVVENAINKLKLEYSNV